MDERIDLIVDVFDQVGQQAQVLGRLTVHEFIQEIIQEFRDDFTFLDSFNPSFYELCLKEQGGSLDANKCIGTVVESGASLLLREKAISMPEGAEPLSEMVYLRESQSERVFKLGWHPAIIGRPDKLAGNDSLLAVNLQEFANNLRVSRRHAQIMKENDQFYLESLSRNPIMINGEVLVDGQRRLLNPDDEILLENSNIMLKFSICTC